MLSFVKIFYVCAKEKYTEMIFGQEKERRSRYNRVSQNYVFMIFYKLTFLSPSLAASALLRRAVTVLLPTPPFPEITRNLFFTWLNFSFTSWIPGSGALGPEAQIRWFGQPAHAEAFPAASLWVPGQSVN